MIFFCPVLCNFFFSSADMKSSEIWVKISELKQLQEKYNKICMKSLYRKLCTYMLWFLWRRFSRMVIDDIQLVNLRSRHDHVFLNFQNVTVAVEWQRRSFSLVESAVPNVSLGPRIVIPLGYLANKRKMNRKLIFIVYRKRLAIYFRDQLTQLKIRNCHEESKLKLASFDVWRQQNNITNARLPLPHFEKLDYCQTVFILFVHLSIPTSAVGKRAKPCRNLPIIYF